MIVITALTAYLVATLLIGIVVKRAWRVSDIDDYFVARRSLSAALSFFTYFSTTYSAFMLIGLAGWSYLYGVGSLGFELLYLIGTVALLSTVGVRIFQVGKQLKLISPAQLIYELNSTMIARYLVPAAYMAFLIPYMSIQLIGPALIMMPYGVPYHYGVMIMALATLTYVLVSGFRGVALTDALQGIIFLLTAAILAGLLVKHVPVVEANHPELFSVPGGMNFWTLDRLVLLAAPWMLFAISNPQVLQRLYTAYDYRAYRRMVVLFSISGLVYTVLTVLIGLCARALVRPEQIVVAAGRPDPNLVTPRLLPLLPEVLASLVVVSIVAAAMSTLDSILLTLSSCISVDVLKGRGGLRAARAIVVLITLLTTCFALTRYGPVVALAVESSAALMFVVPAVVISVYRKVRAGLLDAALVAGLVTYVALKVVSLHLISIPLTVPGIVAALVTTVVLLVGLERR